MPALRRHRERHRTDRIGWLRAAMLGANDGIVSTASLGVFQQAAGTSEIRKLVSDWRVERGVAHAQDVAMATKENRIALHGGLDFVNDRSDDVTVALIDTKGLRQGEAEDTRHLPALRLRKRRWPHTFANEQIAPEGSARLLLSPTSFWRNDMNGIKIAAIALVVAGVLALTYGGFSYTKETHQAKLGPIELSVKDKQTVNIPVWAGVAGIVIGGVLLFYGGKRT